ncbi:MAG: transglutaminase domain-containing protein [Deltaproteobacteria bacterium]|nr:MAG: transglutaminase domain-containing protein [Deltaproteobacteria bacterium]
MARNLRPDSRALLRAASRRSLLLLTVVVAGCRGDAGERPGPATVAPPVAVVDTAAPSVVTPGEGPTDPRPAVAGTAPVAVEPALVEQALRVLEGAGRDTWFGVYMGARKVGNGHIVYRRSEPGEAGAFAAIVDLEMTLEAGGRQARMTASERRFYAAAPSLGLVAAEMEMSASGVRDLRRGRNSADGMHISRTLNGEPQPERSVAGSRDSLAYLAVTNPAAPEQLAPGAERTIYAWDWESEADDEVLVKVDAIDRRLIAGIESHVATLSLVYEASGITMKSRVADGGSVLVMSLGPALTLRQEEEEVAKSGIVGLDVAESGIPVKTALGDPEKISRLVLSSRLPEGFRLPSGPRQQLTAGEGGATLITIVRGVGAPVTAEERAAALAEDATVDWKAKPVRELAATLTAGLETPRAKADALAAWVHDNLAKRLATHLPTASAVLERRVGDCTEHTWLFTALARAAGLPARPVYGVAYAGDLERRFAYHAWAEVEIDGTWQALDPTWGEAVADATHVQLGADLKHVGAALGGLTFEVVSHESVGD